MIKRILTYTGIALASILTPATLRAATAQGDWKLHPSFDTFVSTLADTPDKTYALCYGQGHFDGWDSSYGDTYLTLFVYDKEADELLSYNRRNYLSSDIIYSAHYNAAKNYLLIIYSDWNIDILHDNGSVENIPAIKDASLNTTKTVNGVSFDPDNNRVYLATDFGYAVLDDDKAQVAESRRLSKPLKGVLRVGDRILITTGDKTYEAPVGNHFMSLEEYTPVAAVPACTGLFPINEATFGVKAADRIYKASFNPDGSLVAGTLISGQPLSIQQNARGYIVNTPRELFQIDSADLSVESVNPPAAPSAGIDGSYYGSWNFRDFRKMTGREGLTALRYDDGQWTVTAGAIHPNAPSPYICQDFDYSDKYGLFVTNHGINRQFTTTSMNYHGLTSGLKDGVWTPYSSAINSKYGLTLTDPYGVEFDPDDPRYFWQGSYRCGLIRYNAEDPDDIIVFGNRNQINSNLPGFKEVAPADTWYSYFSAPRFDSDNNLWTVHQGNQYAGQGRLWVLPRNAKNNLDPKGWITFQTPGFSFEYASIMRPLKHHKNKNLVIMAQGNYGGPIAILDHKGTLDNPADDEFVLINNCYDQDGTEVTRLYTYDFLEDPETGLVWVGHYNGVFTIDPRKIFQNNSSVNRIKVSRNDGTNFADYLLDGVGVYRMTVDSKNRKWFATAGAGVTWTSPDGKEILKHITAENSYLPHNMVYGIGYNKGAGSVVVSTQYGLAEYFPPGTGADSESDDLKIYPNPVRPDYLGWITIEGLPDNSLVKIVDAQGNIVKELGICEGGMAQWDGYNLNNKRARTGVYYVIASEGPNGSGTVRKGKVLIVN